MIAWRRLLGLWDTEQPGAKGQAGLIEVVEEARRDWLYAQHGYKTATDPDLIDYFSFLIMAYERRYIYLLKKARKEGMCYPGGISLSAISDARTIRRAF